jgi:hypothetical protein
MIIPVTATPRASPFGPLLRVITLDGQGHLHGGVNLAGKVYVPGSVKVQLQLPPSMMLPESITPRETAVMK